MNKRILAILLKMLDKNSIKVNKNFFKGVLTNYFKDVILFSDKRLSPRKKQTCPKTGTQSYRA